MQMRRLRIDLETVSSNYATMLLEHYSHRPQTAFQDIQCMSNIAISDPEKIRQKIPQSIWWWSNIKWVNFFIAWLFPCVWSLFELMMKLNLLKEKRGLNKKRKSTRCPLSCSNGKPHNIELCSYSFVVSCANTDIKKTKTWQRIR